MSDENLIFSKQVRGHLPLLGPGGLGVTRGADPYPEPEGCSLPGDLRLLHRLHCPVQARLDPAPPARPTGSFPLHCRGLWLLEVVLKKTAATLLLTALAMLVGKIHCQRADVTCSVLHQTPQAPGLVLFSLSPFLPFNSTLTDHRCVCLPPMQYSALRNSDRHLLLAADRDMIRNSIQASSQAGRVNTNTPRTKH